MASMIDNLVAQLPPCPYSASTFEPVVPEGTKVFKDVPYTSNAEPLQRLDLYVPASRKPVPVITYFHDGSFYCGDKTSHLGILRHLTVGYAVAMINFRMVPLVMHPTPIVDCKSAIRWLRANASKYKLNPRCVISTGWSSGGYFAAMVGVTQNYKDLDLGDNLDYSSSVQAVVVMSGPVDFVLMHQYRKETETVGDEHDISEALYLGGLVEDNQWAAMQASPLTHITADAPPFLVIHGDSDIYVPRINSQLLVAKLADVGVPVLYKVLENVEHTSYAGWDNVFWLTNSFLSGPLVTDAY